MKTRPRRATILASVLTVALSIVVLSSCGDDDENQAGTAPSPTPTSTSTSQPGTTGVTITIASGAATRGDDAFGTNPKVIQQGTTVTWKNDDSMPHTVTSMPDESLFNSGNIPPGGTFTHTFEDTGNFDYYCEIHPDMRGSIRVE